MFKIKDKVDTNYGTINVMYSMEFDSVITSIKILCRWQSRKKDFEIPELVIPSEYKYDGECRPITGMIPIVFDYKKDNVGTQYVRKLIIPDCIDDVALASEKWTNLEYIRWPAACPKICQSQFEDFNKLKRIENIDRVNGIGARAFYGTPIETFDWPEDCHTIPPGCFRDCNRLTVVNIKEGTKRLVINENAFKGTSISKIDLSKLEWCGCSPTAFPDNTKIVPPQHGWDMSDKYNH